MGSLSAWDIILSRYPALQDQVAPLEREALELLSPQQLRAFAEGAPAIEITMMNGESLDTFLVRKGATNFRIPWYSIDGGGGRMTGGGFSLVNTFGQPDSDRASGGNFSLLGGFLSIEPESDDGLDAIFRDGFEAGSTVSWSLAVGEI